METEKVSVDELSTEEKHWLVRPNTTRWLWRGGLTLLALLVCADFFVHAHPYFEIDGTFGFFSWFGLVTCIAMVLFAKVLALILKRKDSYYDDE
jgi:uncharacterized membrane protein YhdT